MKKRTEKYLKDGKQYPKQPTVLVSIELFKLFSSINLSFCCKFSSLDILFEIILYNLFNILHLYI